ncbi:interferon-inducible GTPase-domain-containing protein [Suillus variegatus]|nr:interferon-inducible GTPase-domain-containing protein [Suillus variegatus]
MRSLFSQSWPEASSPSLADIEVRQKAEASAEQARQDAAASRAQIVELIKSNQELQQKALEFQQAALQAAAASQDQAHKEMMAMVQAECAAARAQVAELIESNQESQQKVLEAQQTVLQATAVSQDQTHKEMIPMVQAECAAARAQIAELIKSNQELQQKALEAQQASLQAAAISHDQLHREMMATVQAECASNEARLLVGAAARIAGEEARQRASEAEDERKRTAAVQEQAKRDTQAAQEQAKKLQEAANEEKKKATAAQEAANASKKAAEEQVKAANSAKKEAERKLKEGIQPVVTPTPAEVSAAKRKVQYREDLFHFAVAGVAGGGKSSLINAFRGLRNKDAESAATGVTETTLAMVRYASPNAEHPYVWYDIPGAGALKIPDWQYFNAHGLYIFDCIIVLLNNRFTMTDIAILINCKRFKIPTYIVRSKADQHIRNIMWDMGYDSDDDENGDQRKKVYQAARQQFIQQTRQIVKENLENYNMPDQRVYIVSNESMFGVVKERQPRQVIDEIELLNNLIGEAQNR